MPNPKFYIAIDVIPADSDYVRNTLPEAVTRAKELIASDLNMNKCYIVEIHKTVSRKESPIVVEDVE